MLVHHSVGLSEAPLNRLCDNGAGGPKADAPLSARIGYAASH